MFIRSTKKADARDHQVRNASRSQSDLRKNPLLLDTVEECESRALLTAVAASAYVTALYHQDLGRAPQSSELQYWSNALNHGVTPVGMSHILLSSPEHQAIVASASASAQTTSQTVSPATSVSGSLSTAGFVDSLYANVLKTQADAAGEAFWVGLIDKGESPAEVENVFERVAIEQQARANASTH